MKRLGGTLVDCSISEVILRFLNKRMHNLGHPLLYATFGIVSTYSNFKSIRYYANYKSSATKSPDIKQYPP